MKKIFIASVLMLVILTSFSSAEIILSQPKNLYNVGDPLSIQTTIKSSSEINGFLEMFVLCGGEERNFYKEYLFLSSGEEKKINPSILLIKEIVGTAGACKIKATLDGTYVLTEEFKISKLITVNAKTDKESYKPGESVFVEGEAIKENGMYANGVVEIKIVELDKTIIETVNKGYFGFDYYLPENHPAGKFTLNFRIYEKDKSGNVSNEGLSKSEITVEQIPTNIEIFFENEEVEPSTNLKVKGIIRDQTGEKTSGTAYLTIKNSQGKIVDERELQSDEILEYPIAYYENPSTWTITAKSNKLTNEAQFKIGTKNEIDVTLINKTLIIKNIGNTIYNQSLLVKIGNETRNIDLNLAVNAEKKFMLNAHKGEQTVEIITNGESRVSETVMFTGNAIKIEPAGNVVQVIRHPFVWFFIIGIFGFIAFMIFRKGYKRSFIGRKISKKENPTFTMNSKNEKAIHIVEAENKAELSLSIKGDKQDADLISIKIKNLEELQKSKNKGEGSYQDSLRKIIKHAEHLKASIYENGETIFIIFAPVQTKTFKNEKAIITIAQLAKETLDHHNKLFQQKINYGISINHGTIVARKDTESLKFMSMGTFISGAKKAASHAHEEILLTKESNEKMMNMIKTEKTRREGNDFYKITEVRKRDEDNKKFISNFVRRIEGKK